MCVNDYNFKKQNIKDRRVYVAVPKTAQNGRKLPGRLSSGHKMPSDMGVILLPLCTAGFISLFSVT